MLCLRCVLSSEVNDEGGVLVLGFTTHQDTTCSKCEMSPITGLRMHNQTDSTDLCCECFQQLDEADESREQYEQVSALDEWEKMQKTRSSSRWRSSPRGRKQSSRAFDRRFPHEMSAETETEVPPRPVVVTQDVEVPTICSPRPEARLLLSY